MPQQIRLHYNLYMTINIKWYLPVNFVLLTCQLTRTQAIEEQKKALQAVQGTGNSVTERMLIAGADEQSGLAMQSTIFKQYQAWHWHMFDFI